jgi:hypothetical protein
MGAEIRRAWAAWISQGTPLPARALEVARDIADKELVELDGDGRARAMGDQVFAALALQELRRAPFDGFGFAHWPLLSALAKASTGEARAELVEATLEAGGGPDAPEAGCLAALAPLLEPAAVQEAARAALASEPSTADQGLLISMLPALERDALLEPRVARAVAIADRSKRWDALYDLLRHHPDRDRLVRDAAAEGARIHGFEIQSLYQFSRDERSDENEELRAAHERATFGAPFTAWRLGERGRDADDPAASHALLERAIDAFDAIALTPTDPGNDEGPFWAIARLLDEPQVRRALAIVERMSTVRWYGNLSGSRKALAVRLAWLGHWQEAVVHLQKLSEPDDRAACWGGIIGARLALEPALPFEDARAIAEEVPGSGSAEWQYALLDELLYQLSDRPALDRARIEACVAFVAGFDDPRLRRLGVEHLFGVWPGALELARWMEIIRATPGEADAFDLFLALAEAARDADLDPAACVDAALEAMPAASPDPMARFKELCRFRDGLAPPRLFPAWIAFLRHPVDAGPSHPIAAKDFVDELAEVVRWLGGPSAPHEVGRAIVDFRLSLRRR